MKNSGREEIENMNKTTPPREKEEMHQVPVQRLPCRPWWQPWWGSCASALVRTISYPCMWIWPKRNCSWWEPALKKAPGRTCWLVERSMSMLEQVFLKDCTLWKGPILEQFTKNCILGRTHTGWVQRIVSHEMRGRVGGGKRGNEVLQTDHNPHSLSPCTSNMEKVEELGMKLKLGQSK